MSGFAKFCGVVRFIALAFAIIFLVMGIAFLILPDSIVQPYCEENGYTRELVVGVYLGSAIIPTIVTIITFSIHAAAKKKWKKVLKCKQEIGYVFDDIFDRMERSYNKQTDTRIYYTWKRPTKKGYDFHLDITIDVPSSVVNSESLDAVESDFARGRDMYSNELDRYGFTWVIRVK